MDITSGGWKYSFLRPFSFFFMYNRFQIFCRYPEAKIVAAKLAALKLQAAKALPKNKVPNPFRAAHPSLLISVWTPPQLTEIKFEEDYSLNYEQQDLLRSSGSGPVKGHAHAPDYHRLKACYNNNIIMGTYIFICRWTTTTPRRKTWPPSIRYWSPKVPIAVLYRTFQTVPVQAEQV